MKDNIGAEIFMGMVELQKKADESEMVFLFYGQHL